MTETVMTAGFNGTRGPHGISIPIPLGVAPADMAAKLALDPDDAPEILHLFPRNTNGSVFFIPTISTTEPAAAHPTVEGVRRALRGNGCMSQSPSERRALFDKISARFDAVRVTKEIPGGFSITVQSHTNLTPLFRSLYVLDKLCAARMTPPVLVQSGTDGAWELRVQLRNVSDGSNPERDRN